MSPPLDESPELATLAALGFGPDASLMTEPKLFVDARLLAALLAELEDELGSDAAARTLFQIGLIHGLRDGDAVVARGFLSGDARPLNESALWPPLVIDLATPAATAGNGWRFSGRWPELHEAAAWLSKFGPGDRPNCWLSSGYTSGWLSATLEADVIALETGCASRGDGGCHFEVREPAEWRDANAPRRAALDVLGAVDFDLFRALALRSPSGPPPEMIESVGDFDADAPLVHIWGPVMVLPFTNADETLRTVEALSRDASLGDIRSVVFDLRQQMVDEAFDAAAIERSLETIEAWGAEPILTGITELAQDVIESLETDHLLIRKDLDEAIASAFLIAEAQRHAA